MTEETRNGLTERFDEWFDGRAAHLGFALQISLCASRFMTSEVDGDGNVWTRIYGDASTKKKPTILQNDLAAHRRLTIKFL